MRHQIKTIKLGRSQAHRDALLANQAVSLIIESRIKTTLAKAKAVRPFAEKLVTLGKKNTLHSRRTALSILRHNEEAVHVLFSEIAPRCANRRGGYIRIVKLGESPQRRRADGLPRVGRRPGPRRGARPEGEGQGRRKPPSPRPSRRQKKSAQEDRGSSRRGERRGAEARKSPPASPARRRKTSPPSRPALFHCPPEN